MYGLKFYVYIARYWLAALESSVDDMGIWIKWEYDFGAEIYHPIWLNIRWIEQNSIGYTKTFRK